MMKQHFDDDPQQRVSQWRRRRYKNQQRKTPCHEQNTNSMRGATLNRTADSTGKNRGTYDQLTEGNHTENIYQQVVSKQMPKHARLTLLQSPTKKSTRF